MWKRLLPVLFIGLLQQVSVAREDAPEFCSAEDEVRMEAGAPQIGGPNGLQLNFGGQEWQEFFSIKQGFRARFPVLPTREQEKLTPSLIKKPLTLETYQTYESFKKPVKHSSGYLLGVAKIGTNAIPKSKHQPFLEQILKSMQKSYGSGASFSVNKKGEFQGHTAREFVLTYQSNKTQYTLDGVVFLDAKAGRLFQAACLYAPTNKKLLSDCDYFFANFKPLPDFPKPTL